MRRLRISHQVLVTWSLAILLCTSTASSQAAGVLFTFTYKSGEFSDEFLEFVGLYGARTVFVPESDTNLGELVRQHCGAPPSSYDRILATALAEQAVELNPDTDIRDIEIPADSDVALPPCLPQPVFGVNPRVLTSKDRIWDFWHRDFDGVISYDSTSEITMEISAGIGANSTVDFSGTSKVFRQIRKTFSIMRFESTHERTVTRITITHVAAPTDTVLTTSSHGSPSEITQYNIQIARNSMEPGSSPDLVAWSVASNLKSIGLDAQEAAKRSTEATSDLTATAPRSSTAAQQAAIQKALTRYSIGSADYDRLYNTVSEPSAFPRIVLRSDSDLSYKMIFAALNPQRQSADPDKVAEGEIVFVPTLAEQRVEIPLIFSASSIPEDLIESISHSILASGEIKGEVEVFPTLRAMSHVVPGDCGVAPSQADRDAMVEELSLLLMRNRLLQLRRKDKLRPVVILIPDSGMYFDHDLDQNPFRESHFADLSLLPDQAPLEDSDLLDDPGHGTSVAGLALGGPDLIDRAQALGYSITIDPRAIYDRQSSDRDQMGKLLFDAQGRPRTLTILSVKDRPFEEAINADGADIVNLSIGGPEEIPTIEKSMNKSAKTLFIIAAGNRRFADADEGVDIAQHSVYPALYGGSADGRFNFLTVAALKWDRTRAKFSNYSKKHVQIATYGCDIPTWKLDTASRTFRMSNQSGTSFAAPSVSFIAGLIRAVAPRYRASPHLIKARLLASSDLHEHLIENIEDGRVMNPVKALALYDDVVEIWGIPESTDTSDESDAPGENQEPKSSTQLYMGTLENERHLDEFCSGVTHPTGGRLLKVAPHPKKSEREAGKLRYYMLVKDEFETAECMSKSPTIRLRLKGDRGVLEFDWNQVADIVFRHPQK